MRNGGGPPDVAAHVQQCDACTAEAERLRSAIEMVRDQATLAATPAPDCLDDAAVAALASGDHLGADRERFLSHASTCGHCLHRVAAVVRALSDPIVAAQLGATESVRGRRSVSTRFALSAAAVAAAAVLFLVMPRIDGNRAGVGLGTHRAPPAVQSSPVLIAPIGRVDEAKLLRWGSMAGADRYRATLFDTSGSVLFEAETADTSVSVPDTVLLRSGRRYLWKAQARTGWDRWTASKLASFSITSGGRP